MIVEFWLNAEKQDEMINVFILLCKIIFKAWFHMTSRWQYLFIYQNNSMAAILTAMFLLTFSHHLNFISISTLPLIDDILNSQ